MPIPLIVGLISAIGSAATAAGGAAVAAGTAAVGVAGAAATTAVATAVASPVLTSAVVIGTVGAVLQEQENAAREKGFKAGYSKGRIDTKRKFAETTEKHVAKVCGMYGLGMLIVQIYNLDKIGFQIIREVLGEPRLQEEYVRAELNNLPYSAEMDISEFINTVFGKYLNKVSADGIKDCDSAVKTFVNVCAREGYDVSYFYNKLWKPYFDARV